MTFERKPDPSPFPPSHKPGSGKPKPAVPTFYPRLEELANIVAAAYVAERNRWIISCGIRRPPRFSVEINLPDFRKLANVFVTQQIVNYRTYFYVQFESRSNKNIPPTPRQCGGPVAQRRWSEFVGNQVSTSEQLALALRLQRDTFRIAMILKKDEASRFSPVWTPEQILSSVLWQDTLQLSALFRYAVAHETGLRAVLDTYRHTAYLQYLFARAAYDATWGEMIPADLRDQADQAMLELSAIARTNHGKT
mgnify:CR=1 FL=1